MPKETTKDRIKLALEGALSIVPKSKADLRLHPIRVLDSIKSLIGVDLDDINPGQWFAKQFAQLVGAKKVLIQKSGYFARSSEPNNDDIDLINKTADKAFDCALNMTNCVVGLPLMIGRFEF